MPSLSQYFKKISQRRKNIFEQTNNRIHNFLGTQRIYFLHVPKTAGTSFRQMLENEYGDSQVYPGGHYLSQTANRMYPKIRDIFSKNVVLPCHKVLVGHYLACSVKNIPNNYKTVTFLRDPIQRSLSQIVYTSKILNTEPRNLVKDKDFFKTYIANFQTRFFGINKLCDIDHNLPDADEATLKRAIKRLEKINFIGLTERFYESTLMFDKKFKTNMSPYIRISNVSRENDKDKFDELIPALEEHLHMDQIIYQRAKLLFENSYEKFCGKTQNIFHRMNIRQHKLLQLNS